MIVSWIFLPQYVGGVVSVTQHGVPALSLVLDDAVQEDGAGHVVVVGEVCVEEDAVVGVAGEKIRYIPGGGGEDCTDTHLMLAASWLGRTTTRYPGP